MKILRRTLSVALFVAVLVLGWRFAAENAAPVNVDYLAGRFEAIPMWTVLVASFGLGAGLMALYALWGRARAGMIARRYRKTVAALEAEVHQLRNLPLVPDALLDEKTLEPVKPPVDGSN